MRWLKYRRAFMWTQWKFLPRKSYCHLQEFKKVQSCPQPLPPLSLYSILTVPLCLCIKDFFFLFGSTSRFFEKYRLAKWPYFHYFCCTFIGACIPTYELTSFSLFFLFSSLTAFVVSLFFSSFPPSLPPFHNFTETLQNDGLFINKDSFNFCLSHTK